VLGQDDWRRPGLLFYWFLDATKNDWYRGETKTRRDALLFSMRATLHEPAWFAATLKEKAHDDA
jgi:hypothetical protein